jgi:type II secretory pathway pseudopilin PulG
MSFLLRCQPRVSRRQGFTLVEAMVSLGIFSTMVIFVFSIATDVSLFSANTDVSFSLQSELDRSYSRLSEILRKTGWNSAGGIEYPRVTNGGAELEFRVLGDLDGNGYAFSATTGEVEWNPTVFTIRRDPATNVLAVYNGATQVWVLGRFVAAVQFTTYKEVAGLHFKELQAMLTVSRNDRQGNVLTSTTAGAIHMRN